MRVSNHPILGRDRERAPVTIYFDGNPIPAREGEVIAAALTAAGIRVFRTTPRQSRPRGLYCAIGQCTDCAMTVDGVASVRTCVTPVRPGMRIESGRDQGDQP